MNRQSLKPNGHMGLQVLKLGLPSGITQGVFSLAMVFVQALTNQMDYVVNGAIFNFVPAISVAVMRGADGPDQARRKGRFAAFPHLLGGAGAAFAAVRP